MGYDRGDSFPSDFEPNGIQFSSKSKGKLSPQSYPIQYEWKWEYSFLSVQPLMHNRKFTRTIFMQSASLREAEASIFSLS